MMQQAVARTHASVAHALWRMRDQRGQGTVEYVGMVVMVTLLVAAVAVAAKGWAPDIGNALKKALTGAVSHLTDGFG
jgi:Flp pilus assembly pilin Flp